MENKSALIAIFTILLLFVTSVVYGATLQGRLDRFGRYGISTASFVPVSRCSVDSEKILETVNSGSDGMYYFNNVEPGGYILKVWVKGFREKPLKYKIHSSDQEYVNIKPIVIHSLKFDSPREEQLFPEGFVIKPRGTHYSLPADAFLWVILSDSLNNFYLSDKPVVVHKNGKWTTGSISLHRVLTKIHVVMVTEEGNKKFKEKVSKKDWENFKDLPEGSYVIANRNIKVVSTRYF
jgi:hypothetical protein